MKSLKLFGFAVLLAMLSSTFAWAGSASATELYKLTASGSDTLAAGTEVAMTLKAGTSLIVKEDELGTTAATCTGSEIKGKTEASGSTVTVPLTSFGFFPCSDSIVPLKAGKLHISWTSGTNGTVTWSEGEVRLTSTFFGVNVTCSSGAGTAIGTITAAKSSSEHATLDLSAKLSCGIIGTTTWTGTYTVTNPTGLVVEDGVTNTELYRVTDPASDKLGSGSEIAMSQKTGTSFLLKDEFGTTTTTCTGSELKGKTEAKGATVTLPISSLTYSGCSDTIDVLKAGKLHITWTSGTNGTVTWSEAEFLVKSTFFGTNVTCKMGTGTSIGTITGVKAGSEHATFDLSGTVNCGIIGSSPWSGTYTITTPTGLAVEGGASETELYKATGSSTTDKLASGTELAMSLKAGTSLLLKDSSGNTATTCTGSEVKGKTEDGGSTVTIPASTLSFSGCTDTFDVVKAGKLHILGSAGTNGTVSWSGAELSVLSTAFGTTAVCTTAAGSGTAIGTLTGVKAGSEHATLDVAAKISCGVLGTSELTGTYSVTSPTGLNVEEN